MIEYKYFIKHPQISIVVITYNSSPFVEETLKSILNQDFNLKEIEVIISDDCSTDKTRTICERWVNENKDLFYNCIFTQTQKNSGICANYNHALNITQGEWIKFIAGDDILRPNCITEFINHTKISDDKFLICQELHFTNSKKLGVFPENENLKPFLQQGAKKQRVKCQVLHLLRKGTIICGPTIFLNTQTLKELGGFDEKYPFIEDFPLAMKFLKNDYPIGCVDKILIEYRVYSESVSRSNNKFSTSIYNAIDDFCFPLSLKYHKFLLAYHYWCTKYIRNNRPNKFISYFLTCLDVVHIKKRILNS